MALSASRLCSTAKQMTATMPRNNARTHIPIVALHGYTKAKIGKQLLTIGLHR